MHLPATKTSSISDARFEAKILRNDDGINNHDDGDDDDDDDDDNCADDDDDDVDGDDERATSSSKKPRLKITENKIESGMHDCPNLVERVSRLCLSVCVSCSSIIAGTQTCHNYLLRDS